ncbi:MAG: hypothetical protein K0S29_399 [Gammaproteobacteria bacterium]|jgi:sensor histidine kinase regulating citrate/malate metabolism|nr:hypothetical protein [Gammaproteobacteria bacterium]
MKILKSVFLLVGSLIFATAFANSSVKIELQSLSPKISNWAEQSAVLAEVQKANAQHTNYTKAQIKALNKQWQQQLNSSNKPLISSIMNNGLSSLLGTIEEHSNGLYQGIIITDLKGLVIGQTYVPSQYWLGNQASWKKAFTGSPADPYIFAGSSKKNKPQPAMLALPILDDSGKPIGVVMVNIDKTKLD